MKVYVRFYPEPECVAIELDASETFLDLMGRVYESTNIESGDKFKISYKGIPLSNFDTQLSDYDVVNNSTIHCIMVQMKNSEKENNQTRMRVKLNKARNPGVLAPLSDLSLVTIFSFLEAKELVASNAVCRRWRTFTGNNEQLWKYNASALFEQDASVAKVEVKEDHKEEGEEEDDKKTKDVVRKVVFVDTPEHKASEFPYFTWFLERQSAKRSWKALEKFSYRQEVPTLMEISKAKVYKIQKKPVPISEEDEKFLGETDIADVRKKLRTKKGMKEIFKKYKTIEKKKLEWENGNWRSIPEEWTSFDFGKVANASFGVDTFAHADSQWILSYSNGSFSWAKEGQVVYVGHVQAVNNSFVFHQLEVNEETSEGEIKDITNFFELFKLVNADQQHDLKRLIDFQCGKVEDMKTSKAKILVIWEKDFNDKVVPTPVKEAMVSEQTGGFKIFGANAKVYDSSDATLVNLENIHLVYTAVLRTADKDADASSIVVQSLEEHIALGDDNAFKTALASEHFAEEFLRACKDLAGDQKHVGSIISPRGKQNAKSKTVLLSKVTLYFENQENVDKAIEYVKQVLSGRIPEKVRAFQAVESIVEKPTYVIDEVPQWKKNLELKKAQQEKKDDTPKNDTPVNAVPSWQQKLSEKKVVEKKDDTKKDSPRMNETPSWMKNLQNKEKKEIAPEEKKVDETLAKFGLGVLKKTETPVEKKEEKKEEPKFGLGMLKKSDTAPVEKKEEKKEEPMFGLGMLKKTGNPDPAKDNAPKEAKQVDFRSALKKDEKTETEATKDEDKPVEEAKVEEKAPEVETNVVEPVEEPKVEEKPIEEPKVEETPVEEPKVEEKPTEETPVEEPKVVEPVEETKVEEKPVEEKVEEKSEPVPEPVAEPVAEKVEETKPTIEEPVNTDVVQDEGTVQVPLEGKELEKEKLNDEAVENKESQVESQ